MTWERYTSEVTGWEGKCRIGRRFTPRFYCHDTVGSPVALYAEKPPVCHLALTPRVQLLGEAIAWDIGDSFSATDTVDLYWIDWGGATDIGDLASADFQATTSGNVVYDALGTYTIEAYVRDVLGTDSQHVFIVVEIVAPVERTYIATTGSGVFVSDNGSTPAASNSGLSGDQLKIRSLRVNPHYADLPAAQQHVWIATDDGISYSTDGAATWSNISRATLGTPENAAADDPAPGTNDLDQIDIAFDPQDQSRIYLYRTQASPKRAWRYMSEDYGATWENEAIGI